MNRESKQYKRKLQTDENKQKLQQKKKQSKKRINQETTIL